MKGKEIFLDFTPLLDVTLIVLFFFILFGTMNVTQAKQDLEIEMEKAQEAQVELEYKKAQHDKLLQEAQIKSDKLDEDLAILADADAREAANIKAMMAFNRNANLKLILSVKEDIPELQIVCGEKLYSTVIINAMLEKHISDALAKSGYEPEDAVFCEFILDGSEDGTRRAYEAVHTVLDRLRVKYHYFYTSETDLSIGKE